MMTQWLNRCSHSWEPQHHALDIFDIYLLATVTWLNCWIAVFWVDSCYLMVHQLTWSFWHEVSWRFLVVSSCIFVAFCVAFWTCVVRCGSWGSSIGPWCPLFSTRGEAAVAIPLGPEPQNNSIAKQKCIANNENNEKTMKTMKNIV